MKFGYIVMGNFDSKKDRAAIAGGQVKVAGVKTLDEACEAALKMQSEGVDCVELCGAFGEKGARAVIRATGRSLPVGYVSHLPEQDHLYAELFGR